MAFDWLIYLGISIGLGLLSALYYRPPRRDPAEVQEFNRNSLPIAEFGAPVPMVFGTTRISPLNTIAFGREAEKKIERVMTSGGFFGFFKKSRTTTIGWEYFATFALGVCLGPVNAYHRVWFQGNVIRDQPIRALGPTAVETRRIDRRDYYAPRGEGGGYGGQIKIYWGAFTQQPDETLNRVVAEEIDGFDIDIEDSRNWIGYNNLSYVLFTGDPRRTGEQADPLGSFYLGEQNTLMQIGFEVERIPNPLRIPNEINRIPDAQGGGYDMNPASLIYHLLTNAIEGRGIDTELLDRQSFVDAANTLASPKERNGYSTAFIRDIETNAIISDILNQIDGIMYTAPNQKLKLRLIRYDYSYTDLKSFGPQNIVGLPNITRLGLDDTVNQYKVQFPDRSREYGNNIVAQIDQADLDMGRALRTEQQFFRGVSNRDLANRLAERELNFHKIPKTQIEMTVLASDALRLNPDTQLMEPLEPGDVIIVTYPKDNMNNAIVRIQSIELNPVNDAQVVITATQDQFDLHYQPFVPEAPTVIPAPRMILQPPSFQRVLESPYLFSGTGQRLMYFALPGDDVANGFAVDYTTDDGQNWFHDTSFSNQPFDFMEPLTLTSTLSATGDSLTLETSADASSTILAGLPPVFGDAALRRGELILLIGNEFMVYRTASISGQTAVLGGLERGLLDGTAPEEHLAGDRVLIFGNGTLAANRAEVLGASVFYSREEIEVRIRPQNASGILARERAVPLADRLTQRARQPLAPIAADALTVRRGLPGRPNILHVPWRFRSRTATEIKFRGDPADEISAAEIRTDIQPFAYFNIAGLGDDARPAVEGSFTKDGADFYLTGHGQVTNFRVRMTEGYFASAREVMTLPDFNFTS